MIYPLFLRFLNELAKVEFAWCPGLNLKEINAGKSEELLTF